MTVLSSKTTTTTTTTTTTGINNRNASNSNIGSTSNSRKRSIISSTNATTSTTTISSLTSSTSSVPTQAGSSTSVPPKYVLVLDNGSDTIKYGYYPYNVNDTNSTNDVTTTTTTTFKCHSISNITARLAQQWKVIIGDDIYKYHNRSGGRRGSATTTSVTHSMERSIITNMGNQIQIWKYILDILNVSIMECGTYNNIISTNSTTTKNHTKHQQQPRPPPPTETSIAFGWHLNQNNNNKNNTKMTKRNHTEDDSIENSDTNNTIIPSYQCTVMIGIAPYTPRSIIDHIISIWLSEFHFHSIGLCVSSVAAAAATVTTIPQSVPPPTSLSVVVQQEILQPNIACVVDLGYSATYVIPVYNNRIIPVTRTSDMITKSKFHIIHKGTSTAAATPNATINTTSIRRIPVGGKHMINILKYYFTYRQWNLMDADIIVRDIMEQTCFVSLQYIKDMQLASSLSRRSHNKKSIGFGTKYYDRQYILPDYDTTFHGQVHIPDSVVQQEEEAERLKLHDTEENENQVKNDEDEDDEEDDEDYNDADIIAGDDDDDDDNYDDDDEEESPDQIRQRLIQQREEERRLRDMEAEQQQVLNISTERFAVPEALFRPSDIGLSTDIANVPQAIVQSIEACPMIYRPALYSSIVLTGGLSLLPNIQERLYNELRALVPSQYTIKISITDKPIHQAWYGIVQLTRTVPHNQWSVSREEWESGSKRGAWIRLQMNKGGYFI